MYFLLRRIFLRVDLARDTVRVSKGLLLRRQFCIPFSAVTKVEVRRTPVLRLLQQEGALVKVSEGLWYDAAAVEDLKKRTRAWFESHDDLPPGDFKEVTGGLTRKYLIPLLEYFDRERFTMRVGDRRQLRGRVS